MIDRRSDTQRAMTAKILQRAQDRTAAGQRSFSRSVRWMVFDSWGAPSSDITCLTHLSKTLQSAPTTSSALLYSSETGRRSPVCIPHCLADHGGPYQHLDCSFLQTRHTYQPNSVAEHHDHSQKSDV
jgi:hypothetical protein